MKDLLLRLVFPAFCAISITDAFAPVSRPRRSSNTKPRAFTVRSRAEKLHDEATATEDAVISRRTAVAKPAACVSLFWASTLAMSRPAQAAKTTPDEAFANLILAREELITAAKRYLPKRDFEGMREFLANEATNINNFEANSLVLLESKRLDVESKKEIGTIRRYGVGADVMIMYGGLKTELDETNEFPNLYEIQKYLTRTLDSLEEVIVICRSNGFK